jgi:hypothetical protein
MLSDRSAVGASGLSALIGQISGGAEPNLLKVLELARSKRIVHEVLFRTANINGQTDYFANHFINLHQRELYKAWKKSRPELVGFRFKHDSIANFSYIESAALASVYDAVGSRLSTATTEGGLLTANFSSANETFSLEFLLNHYDALSNYYSQKTTEQQANTIRTARSRVDSLKSVMYGRADELGQFMDSRLRSVRFRKITEENVRQGELSALGVAYAEAMKNMEIARMSIAVQMPYLQLVDPPMYPLERGDPNKFASVLMAFIAAGFLMSIYYWVRAFIQYQMSLKTTPATLP